MKRRRSTWPDQGRASLAELVGTRPRDAAPGLLGLLLEAETDEDGPVSGRIVEVEAYEGSNDPASHARSGPTTRNDIMFGPAGRLYVYRSYGVHWCANIVCGPEGQAGAVLVRAVEPVDGIERMWSRRPKARTEHDLCSGPGKLCAALDISGVHNGVDLLDPHSPVRLARRDVARSRTDSPVADRVVSGPRIGISRATDRPWRFAVAGSPHLSRPLR
jgi:DNA-3-methyladenine glycosylase